MSTRLVEFFVAGKATTQGSKKAFNVGGRPRMVETREKELRPWRAQIATEAQRAMEEIGATCLFDGPVSVVIHFAMTKPASAPKRKRTYPVGARSGDLDKLARAVLDGITSVVVADDSQVIELYANKDWAHPDELPGAHVWVMKWGSE